MKHLICILTIFLVLKNHSVSAQNRGNELVDSKSSIKYILDSSRTFVSAINKEGILLWKASPFEHKPMKPKGNWYDEADYLAIFSLGYDEFYKDEAILIRSNLNWYLSINKRNGEIHVYGKD